MHDVNLKKEDKMAALNEDPFQRILDTVAANSPKETVGCNDIGKSRIFAPEVSQKWPHILPMMV